MSTRASWHRQLRDLATAYGWRVLHTRSGHFKLVHPDTGARVYAPGSPSDWRALRNLRSDLRRKQWRLPPDRSVYTRSR